MKILLLLLSFSLFAKERIVADIEGMVCSFCAHGIKTSLLKRKEIENVKVDLDKKKVFIIASENINDEEIKKVIINAGYEVSKIEKKVIKQEE